MGNAINSTFVFFTTIDQLLEIIDLLHIIEKHKDWDMT